MTRPKTLCCLLAASIAVASPLTDTTQAGMHGPGESTISVGAAGSYVKIQWVDACASTDASVAVFVAHSPMVGDAAAWVVAPALAGCAPIRGNLNESPDRPGVGFASSITDATPADGTWTILAATAGHAASIELGIRPATIPKWWGACGTVAAASFLQRNHDQAQFTPDGLCPDTLGPEAPRLDPWLYAPANTPDPTDFDADGSTSTGETSCGSRPDKPGSRCGTDDDGDGTANQAEAFFQGEREPCTGSYGWIQPPSPLFVTGCGGYATPPGWQGHDQVYVEQTSTPKRVWVHDSICVPATGANYAACKGGASNYATNTVAYTGDYRSDGYGWRMAATVPLLQGVTVQVPEACAGFPRDQDGDGVAVISFCKRAYTISTGGQVTVSPTQTPLVGPLGDPDDTNNQVPLPTLVVVDADADGFQSGAEVLAGSHPASPQSTPVTDDDGDGAPNQAEPAGQAILLGGAWGLVLEHDHYRRPPGWTPGTVVFHRDPVGNLWIWDAYCAPAYRFEYQTCRTTSNPTASPTLHGGDFVNDGYGWRNRGPIGLEAAVPVYEPCTGYPKDADQDLVFELAVCRRTLTVYANGTTRYGPQELVQPGLGDEDDADPQRPVPFMVVHEKRRELEELVAQTLGTINETVAGVAHDVQTLVNDTIRAVQDIVNGTDGLPALVSEFVDRTLAEADQLIDSATDAAAQLQLTVECVERHRAEYSDAVTASAQTFLAAPDAAHRQGLQDALVLGGTLLLSGLAECDAVGAVATFVLSTYQATASAVVSFAEALNETIANAPNPTVVVLDVLGDTGEAFGGITETLFGALADVRAEAIAFVVSTQEAVGEAIEDFANADLTQATQQLAQDAAEGQAHIAFHATNTAGEPLAGVHIELFRGDARVRVGNTSNDGTLVVRVEANQTYRYTANKLAYAGVDGQVNLGAAGTTQSVNVVLRTQLEATSFDVVPPLAFGASLLVVGILIGLTIRRRRR